MASSLKNAVALASLFTDDTQPYILPKLTALKSTQRRRVNFYVDASTTAAISSELPTLNVLTSREIRRVRPVRTFLEPIS